ncbi:CaiB/BaiF CoA transferase family protein [Rhizorhapis suberifaciens]|uniref:Alpha-methylacyl-CoA racemase n=1 Tax=Rhizorhapis suberifaciens TaxID=13656 RepID=A0A840HV38_9SPHN|nr:CaiB/BaiF CoA-transferase family protein [Rhizorhapis suberifaciens]MBB4641430.1 alpha-methylacyl-CoA racemase [Rhizorhapis suberifaciens]
MTNATGPLAGVKVVEFGGLGPGPFAGTMLSDMGADILRIDRKGAGDPPATRIDARGRLTIALDLKSPADIAKCLEICESAEIVFEGFRPGVMERLGLGPDVMLARNGALVYGRMTGWGQTGPYAPMAGHDINYLAITGALHAIGTADKPVPPLNLVADYGGGGMLLVAGLLAALIQARASGKGQVVDTAICDGSTYLMSLFYGMLEAGTWTDKRSSNLLDGAAHFYDTYRCADGEWISIGSIEPQFYALLLEKTGAEDLAASDQMDQAKWPEMKARLKAIFLTRTRQEWCKIMEYTDICFAPVLSMTEAPDHPHNVARGMFVTVDGVRQPTPAPRFSATPSAIRWAPAPVREDIDEAVSEWARE